MCTKRSQWIILLLLTGTLQAYSQEEKLVQLSGIVRNEQLEPLQFVHIVVLNKHRGTISDFDGMFSFVVEASDTVQFSAVGYKNFYVYIPSNPTRDHFNVEIPMKTDTIMIGEVIILPWKTYQEFKEAFVSLKLPDDDLKRAYRNIAKIMAQIEKTSTPDPYLNYQYLMSEYFDQLYTQGQMPYYSVLDPMRWKKFFKYLEEGKFKNSKK